jgi:hypothetical protein
MTYQQFHQLLIVIACCVLVLAVVGTLFYFGIVLQAGVAVIAIALLWIGWELHRIAQLAVNFMCGYEEAILARKQTEGN